MMYFIEKDMDEEARDNFRKVLDQAGQPKLKTKRHLKAVPVTSDKSKTVTAENVKKWRAPEGWTPSGWDENKSYLTAKQFMGWKVNPK